MNTALTITREFHTARRRDGKQHLHRGAALETPRGKIPRISRLMALAIYCDELLRTGQVANQSALAELSHITTARMTQILSLLNLAPDIQEGLLFLPRTMEGRDAIHERDVRRIAMESDWGKQREVWKQLVSNYFERTDEV
jgi:hypothetical protein